MAESEPYIEIKNLTKRFHQVVANDRVSLTIKQGEIHCLLGENGAGKSTLAECLYGFYQPEEGEIFCQGREVQLFSPADAIKIGIGMVHQHFVLVPTMTVLENIVIGTDSTGVILDLKTAEDKVHALCTHYEIELDLHAKIRQLPVGTQQWVEILKALYIGAKLLILDEPTAVLTPQESERLFSILRKMTSENLSIVLISHKLNEVMQSDRVTILRKGKKIDTVITRETSKEELTSKMVGRAIESTLCKEPFKPGETVLAVSGLHAANSFGRESLSGVDFQVRKGEIVGIAGVASNGQKELFESLIGVRHATQGQVLLNGEAITNLSPYKIQKKGVAFIPDDRFLEGLVPSFPVSENLILGSQREERFSKYQLLDNKKINDFANTCVEDFEIKTPSISTIIRTLSGGNAQKVIVAREFALNASLTLANQPSRGLDIGVIEYMHRALLNKRDEGGAVLLASEDLDELFNLVDTLLVMHDGRITGCFPIEEADIKTVGLLMAGDSVESISSHQAVG